MNKVAITGAGGFVGSRMVEILKSDKNYKVKLFDIEKSPLFNLNELVRFIKNQNVIFHLAGITDSESPDLYKVNVLGTLNLLEAMRISGSRARLVFASTFGVYKIPQKNDIVTENFEIFPRNAYGISKKVAEDIIIFYSKTYGINISIARLSNVYGPGITMFKRSVISDFISLAKNNKELSIIGNGTQTRDFVYVDDVVSALLIMANSKNALIANVCSGQEISLNNLIKLIQGFSKIKIKTKYLKAKQTDLGYWNGKSLLLDEPFNWKPSVSLQAGLGDIWKKAS